MNNFQTADVESIPPALGILLKKLEFLSMIQKGKKPCMYDWTFVDAASWSGVFYRMFRGETKYSMMLHIQNIMEETVRGFNDYPLHRKIMINTLFRAKRGIENLKYTYQDYPDTVASIIVVIQNIEIQERKYAGLLDIKSDPINIPPIEYREHPSLKDPVPKKLTPDTSSEKFERPPSSRIIPMLPSSKMGHSYKSTDMTPPERVIKRSDIIDDEGELKLTPVAADPTDQDTMLVYPELDDIDNGTFEVDT
jgi:hypothetical protein